MDINEILKNIDDFFANTPKEIIDEIDAKVAAVSFPDVSYEEYLSRFTDSYDFLNTEIKEYPSIKNSLSVRTGTTEIEESSSFSASVSAGVYGVEQNAEESSCNLSPNMWYSAA